MSYEEYKQAEFEGGLTEWVDGEVTVHMPPKWEANYNPLTALGQIVGVEQLIQAIQSETS